jgi:hypothetical protein
MSPAYRETHLFALSRGALEGSFVLWTLGRILEHHVHVIIVFVGLRHVAEVVVERVEQVVTPTSKIDSLCAPHFKHSLGALEQYIVAAHRRSPGVSVSRQQLRPS